jgi:hypothetical protein
MKLTSEEFHPQAHVAAELADVGCAALWPPYHGLPTVSREDTDVNKKKKIYDM